MPQSILIFDFGPNEEAAQQGRHKLESWKQAFRLGDKLQLKFERVEPKEQAAESGTDETEAAAGDPAVKKSQSKKVSAKKKEDENKGGEEPPHIRILIRLAFSDHEKLSHQRWLDRIVAEEPFKSVQAETLRQTEPAFDRAAELFDSLD